MKTEKKGNQNLIADLSRAQEYVNALANIGEPIKDKDSEMLDIFRLREEYNGLKSYSIACSPHIAFNELQRLLHDQQSHTNNHNNPSSLYCINWGL